VANTVEIIVKAIDEASKVLADVEGNAEKSLGGVEAAAAASAAQIALIASAASAAIGAVVSLGAAFAKNYSELLSFANALDKANQSTGVSLEFWQKLVKSSDEMNVSFDFMRGAIERLEKNLEGSGAALRKFGIDVADYQKLTPDEAVRRFAMQLEAITDPMEKTAVAMAATGKAGAENIAMWHAIATGAVDAQDALGKKMVDSLIKTEEALSSLATSWKTLKQEFVAVTASSLGLEERFRGLAADAKALALILDQWPGLWQALGRGVLDTTVHMIEAAKAAKEHEVQFPKTGSAVLGLTETTRQLTKGLDELVTMWQKEAKEEDKNTKSKEANAKKLTALWTARMTQLSKEAEESRKSAEAEIKAMNAEAKAEADLTAKIMAEEAKRLDAVQKTRQKEAEAAERYFERVIENGLRANETEIQGAQRVLEEVMRQRAELVANVESTGAQIMAADAAVAAAQKAVDDEATRAKIANVTLILDSASTILRALFGKSKAAAIAAAIIDTLASIVKTLASYPWPWSLVPAAAAAAVGYANVQKIRSQDAGFAQGTPGTSFVDFGAGTPSMLHGEEAVVTRSQGEGVASMVRDAIREGFRGVPQGRASRDERPIIMHLDGQVLGRWVSKRSRAGLMPLMGT